MPAPNRAALDFLLSRRSRPAKTLTGPVPGREELCTIPAVAHGGAVMALADTLGAAGTLLNLPEGAHTTTVESKTIFLAAGPVGTVLTGEATPVHRGRTTMVWHTRVTTEEGRLAALVTQTQLVISAKS